MPPPWRICFFIQPRTAGNDFCFRLPRRQLLVTLGLCEMEADQLDFRELQCWRSPKKTLSGILHLFHSQCKHESCLTQDEPEAEACF